MTGKDGVDEEDEIGCEEDEAAEEEEDQREPRMHQRCCYPMPPLQSPYKYSLSHVDARS